MVCLRKASLHEHRAAELCSNTGRLKGQNWGIPAEHILPGHHRSFEASAERANVEISLGTMYRFFTNNFKCWNLCVLKLRRPQCMEKMPVSVSIAKISNFKVFVASIRQAIVERVRENRICKFQDKTGAYV